MAEDIDHVLFAPHHYPAMLLRADDRSQIESERLAIGRLRCLIERVSVPDGSLRPSTSHLLAVQPDVAITFRNA